jgi:hypothetical protein
MPSRPSACRTAAGVRLVRVQVTLSLERLLASDALVGDLQARDGTLEAFTSD